MPTVDLFDKADYKNKPGNYMAVVLTGCHVKVYTGDGSFLQKTALVVPDFMAISVKKFMEYIDNMLDLFLNFYPLPVFVFGSPVAISHFKNVTSHKENIVYFFANCGGGITEDAIKHALPPVLNNLL